MDKKIFFILFLLQRNFPHLPLSKYYIQKKYLGLLHFIHEFHHFLEINEIRDQSNKSLQKPGYCISNNGYNYNKESGIYNVQIPSNKNIKNFHEKEIIKLKFFLSGYAAENAYKKHFYLLALFNKSIHNIYKDDFILLLYYHYVHQKLIDIENALKITKQISYDTPEIQYYIDKYKCTVIKNKHYNALKKYNKNENEIILLYGIYQELLEKYSQKKYYKKLYNIIDNNPEVFTMEIFFLSDLQELLYKEKLSRDLTNLSKYNIHEIKIIKNLKDIYNMSKNIELLNLFKNKIKETILLLHKKKKSFYNTFKAIFS